MHPLDELLFCPWEEHKMKQCTSPELRDMGLLRLVLFQFLTVGSAGVECAVVVPGAGAACQGKGTRVMQTSLYDFRAWASPRALCSVKPDLYLDTRRFTV